MLLIIRLLLAHKRVSLGPKRERIICVSNKNEHDSLIN